MLAHGLAQGRVRPSNSTYHLVPVPTMAIYFMAGGKEEGRLSCGVLQAGWGANRTYRILGNSSRMGEESTAPGHEAPADDESVHVISLAAMALLTAVLCAPAPPPGFRPVFDGKS